MQIESAKLWKWGLCCLFPPDTHQICKVEAVFEKKKFDKSKAEELSYLILVWLPWSSKPASLRAFLHLDTKWEEKETMVVRPKDCRFALHNGSISFLRSIYIFLQLTISQFSNHRSIVVSLYCYLRKRKRNPLTLLSSSRGGPKHLRKNTSKTF